MKRYLEENPDKAYYRAYHYSKGPSYPEIYWKDVLTNAGLSFETELRLGRFRLDFAFLASRIDLEIDGQQHYSSEEAIQRDKRRDEYLESKGWSVIRVVWGDFKRLGDEDKIKFISNLLDKLR